MMDPIQHQLNAEPKPTLSPFFPARVAARAAARQRGRRLFWVRAYWLLAALATLAIFSFASLPPNVWYTAATIFVPFTVILLLSETSLLRRLLTRFFWR